MAMLYVKTPNGTTKSIDLETMNIPGSHVETSGWYKFPNGIIYQWGTLNTDGNETVIVTLPISVNNGIITGHARVRNGDSYNGRVTIQGNVQFASGDKWASTLIIWEPKFDSGYVLKHPIGIRWYGMW